MGYGNFFYIIPILINKFEFRNSLPIVFEILFLTDIQEYEFRNALPNLMGDLLLNANLFLRIGITFALLCLFLIILPLFYYVCQYGKII